MSDDQGFASMDEDEQKEIASMGGQAQSTEAKREGGEHSSDEQDMSELGKMGAEAQPHEAKVEGGEHSHDNDN